MNFWKKISMLGVSEDMPIGKQKSTIFFNIVMRIAIFAMSGVALLMFLFLDFKYVPLGILFGMPFIGLSLFLNYKGKINFSVFFTSLFFPVYFLALSIFSKSNGEGLTVILSVIPRFGIIIMSAISFAVIGFEDNKKAFGGAFFGLVILILFNKIHFWFGIDIKNLPFRKEHLNALIYGLGGILIFILMVVKVLQKINAEYEEIVRKQKEELEDKNIEITAQNAEIEAQRDNERAQKEKIEIQNKEITDSIRYASRIQNAALPSLDYIAETFDLFIFFRPRDIVSGDFYWFKKVGKKSIIVTADCTGHGVPGAFVSLLGISFLNEIVTEKNVLHSDTIVNELRNKMKSSLHQQEDSEQKDGMDLSLYIIEEEKLTLEFTGAQNPIYIVRKDARKLEFEQNIKIRLYENENQPGITLIELKPDRMPVGIHLIEKDFHRIDFQLQKNDIIYSFSDGFVDQFGGENNEKYLSRNFKRLLTSISNNSISDQKKKISSEFSKWKNTLNQLDDVLVIGLKI